MAPLFEILDYRDTPLGQLCLRRRELLSRPGTIVTEVTLDHAFLMSSYHTESERRLANKGLEMVADRDGLQVLVGGLGLGFTAREVLKSPRVARLEVVELLEPVMAWLENGWLPTQEHLEGDPRLKLTCGDVYARLLGPAAESWDLILIDVDHAPGEPLDPASAPLYSTEGLSRVAEHFRPGGVLVVWSTHPDPGFRDSLAAAFDHVETETVSWWNDLIDEQKDDTLFAARTAERP